jgi:hypothetical protein
MFKYVVLKLCSCEKNCHETVKLQMEVERMEYFDIPSIGTPFFLRDFSKPQTFQTIFYNLLHDYKLPTS